MTSSRYQADPQIMWVQPHDKRTKHHLGRDETHFHPNIIKFKSQRSPLVIISLLAYMLNYLELIQSQPSASLLPSTTPSAITGANGGCQLPATWTGRWYQANKEPIRITNTEISDKGHCRDQSGDKFLFELEASNSRRQQACLMCLVINERHLNVLQYKESSCQPIPANYYNRSISSEAQSALLDSICSDITGDAPLESLFRLDTPPIECPISGQYSFNYDNCRESQSTLDSCIDKKQLNFKFHSCPESSGSENKSEILRCYADWSEGNNFYMIGRLESSTSVDKGKFRCFIYERSSDGKSIQLAQSVEETCYGLINPNEGPKTLRLTVRPAVTKCSFPSFIESQSENWLSVDNSLIYMFNQNSSKYQVKETKEGNVIEEATCLQQFTYPQAPFQINNNINQQHQFRPATNGQQAMMNRRHSMANGLHHQADQASDSYNVYLVQITKNCQTANYCVRFYKRTSGIVQIDFFKSDGQCRNAFLYAPQTQIITSTNLEHQRCPFEGAYTIEASFDSDRSYNPSNIFVCPRQSFLTAQCDQPSRLRIHSKCTPGKFSYRNLYCLGSWTSNGIVRVLLADDEHQRYSAWFRDYQSMQQYSNSLELHARLSPHGNTGQASSDNVPQIVDLSLALITPLPTVAKTMQVRLTKRNQCSDLKGYLGQPTLGQQPASSHWKPSVFGDPSASSSHRQAFPALLLAHLAPLLMTFLTLLGYSTRRHTAFSSAH